MRGTDETSGSLFSYVDLEERIPARHPLRKIRRVVNDALVSMNAEFDRLYASDGRPSIAPERLLRASLIQILFSVRSERQLMEQMQYNLLFRWFVGLGIDDAGLGGHGVQQEPRPAADDGYRAEVPGRDPRSSRDRAAPVGEHFSVDGTLIKAWASMKSFQPKPEQEATEPGDGGPHDPPAPPPSAEADPTETQPEPAPMTPPKPRTRNAEVDFRGQKRSNATHA
ncbi:transposase, partial [Cereibacter azotoformans]